VTGRAPDTDGDDEADGGDAGLSFPSFESKDARALKKSQFDIMSILFIFLT
jgi:hypothetical protein